MDELASKLIVLSLLFDAAGRVWGGSWACAAPQKRHSDRNILTEHGERDSFIFIGSIALLHWFDAEIGCCGRPQLIHPNDNRLIDLRFVEESGAD